MLFRSSDSKAKYNDDRYWPYPIDEKTKNGTALIRFLPSKVDNSVPWVVLYSHGFQGPGGWYVENSLTTIGQQDPVTEMNNELWNSGVEANKDLVRKRKRKQYYIANIYVISDPKNPQNEGKVFLFKFGKKIFSKIKEKLTPEFEGEKPQDIFDFLSGCNFRLKIKSVEGYPNYDSSSFESPSALLDGTEKKLLEVFNQMYDLQAEISPEKFKSYEELEKKLNRVLGNSSRTPTSPVSSVTPSQSTKPHVAESASADDESDDAMKYFQQIADEE
mgnify:FL=1